MNKTKLILFSSVGLLLFVLATLLIMSFSYTNQEVRLREQIMAQETSNMATFDNMWAVISGQAQVADRYKESFQSVYENIMSSRYGESGRQSALLDFLQESNPQFDASIFNTLSQTIEAQRNTFLRNQQRLIDLNREHTMLLQTIPSKWFLSDKDVIDITVVTSESTVETFETGIEQPRSIF